MWPYRVFTSTIFLFLIVFTIPLSFDVGGRTCGLAFSLSLAVYYFLYSVLRLITPDTSRFRYAAGKLVQYTQWLTIVTLLIWSLNKFSVDADGGGGVGGWVARTFDGKRAGDETVREWIFGRGGLLESSTIGGWDKLLRWSTPVFQIGEGFCSLLVIQACGQIVKWLVNQERGDSWMIGLLAVSASVISSSAYFIWRITKFPDIGNVDALLIGAAVMCAVMLGAWGIGSGRGNPVESSLLFAYITLCLYQIFTDYEPSSATIEAASAQPALPPLPPIIMASYTTLLHALETVPSTIQSFFHFLVAVVMTITPSVIISLAYRVFVMYAAARIIPAIRESGARALSQEPSLEDSDAAGQLMGFLSWFSPSILVAVYTSLLMQHFASTSWNGNGHGHENGDWWSNQGGDVGGNLVRWLNLWFTMALYAVELYIGRMDDDGRLTSHWKTD